MVEGTKFGLRIFFLSEALGFEILGFLETEEEEEEEEEVTLARDNPQSQRLLRESEKGEMELELFR